MQAKGGLFGCRILKHFFFNNVCKGKTCCKQVLKSPHRLVYSLAHKYNNSASEEPINVGGKIFMQSCASLSLTVE